MFSNRSHFKMSKISGLMIFICGYSVIIAPSYGMELKLPGKIITAAITPFDDCGHLNLKMVPKLAKYYLDNNLTNIAIMGFEGEGASLRMKERKALIAAWVDQGCLLGLNIIVEVGLQSFVNTLSLASYCSKLNVTAITHFPEQVYKAKTIEEAVEDLRRVSEAAPNLPLIYNELLSTAPESNISLLTVGTDAVILAKDRVPTLAGVETNINTYLDSEAGNPKCNQNLLIIIYDIQYMYAAFLLGLSTVTLSPSLFPKTVKAMEAAADNCDRDTAKQLQNQMNTWVSAITNLRGNAINTFLRTYFMNLKAAFQIITGMNVGARVPFDRTNSTAYDQIASNLKLLGVPKADPACH